MCWIYRELKDKGTTNPNNIELFKVNHRNNRKRCEICSELIIKTTRYIFDHNMAYLDAQKPPATKIFSQVLNIICLKQNNI